MDEQTAPAALSFGMTHRIRGKVIVLIENAPRDAASWEVTSVTRRGTEAPARIVFTADGTPALLVAVLSVTQTAHVRATDAQGRVLALGEHTLAHQRTRVVSALYRKLRKPHTLAVREDELELADNRVSLRDLRIVPDGDGAFLHADLLLFAADGGRRALADVPVELVALDAGGAALPASGLHVLGDECETPAESSDVRVRRIRYSLRISSSCPALVLWVRFSHRDFADNFWPIDPTGLENLRRDSLISSFPAELSHNYTQWFMQRRTNDALLACQRAEQASFAVRPRFSLIMPLYHTPPTFFREATDSVLAQSYPELELVLVNATPEDEALAEAVAAVAATDGRVRVVTLENNRGITENTNAGIAVATGEFLAFMDHDDVLERDLLYWYAKAVSEHPDTDLIYCDEDLLSEGRFVYPILKPDWDMRFLETNNYVCHLLAVRRSLFEALPRPTADLDGAQDHRLALMAGELARRVHHVRRVLYHWRSHSLSTASDPAEKPESLAAGKRAIDAHFRRIAFPAQATPRKDWLHIYRVDAHTGADGTSRPTVSLILWGDAPRHPVAGAAALDGSCELYGAESLGAGGGTGRPAVEAVARQLARATGDVIVLLHRAALPLAPSWLDELAAYALRKDVGIVSPRLVYADGTLMSVGIAQSRAIGTIHMGNGLGATSQAGRGVAQLTHDVTAVSALCLAIERRKLDAVGSWDAAPNMDVAVIGLCRRMRGQGLAVTVLSETDVVVSAGHEHIGAEGMPLPEADPFFHPAYSADGRFTLEGGWKWALIPPAIDRRAIGLKLRY